MAKSNTERVEALRLRRANLKQKRREFSLTDEEKLKVDEFVKGLRKGS